MGAFSFNVSEVLSGFSICDMQEDGYEQTPVIVYMILKTAIFYLL